MRVVLFFMCLCFLLLQGDAPVFAGSYHSENSYAVKQPTENKQPVILIAAGKAHAAITDPNLDTELEYFIGDDKIEDEDSNDFSAQKDRLPARSHLVNTYPSYPAILNYRCNCFKAPPFFFRPVTDKCILLSILRI